MRLRRSARFRRERVVRGSDPGRCPSARPLIRARRDVSFAVPRLFRFIERSQATRSARISTVSLSLRPDPGYGERSWPSCSSYRRPGAPHSPYRSGSSISAFAPLPCAQVYHFIWQTSTAWRRNSQMGQNEGLSAPQRVRPRASRVRLPRQSTPCRSASHGRHWVEGPLGNTCSIAECPDRRGQTSAGGSLPSGRLADRKGP